ncbi:acyltransferase [Candidatus Dojkabacteria bacterium]|nr:acyltransferase [Candidatus Dojkabacteria bacterium]
MRIQGPGKAILGNNVIAGAHEEPNIFSTFDRDATIEIGDNCRLNGAHFQSRKGIKIGNSCIIGSALLVDTDHHSVRSDRMTNPNSPVLSKPIEIGNNVWIAGHATILKGVTIGNNSVVGFGSVVASDVPQDSIVAGNPAKVIGKVPMVSGTI